VTRLKSRQFNFSSHAKINYIEFEDEFSIKTHANVKYFLPEDCRKKYPTSWEKTNEKLNDFLQKCGTIGLTERTTVNGRPFCAIFSFTR